MSRLTERARPKNFDSIIGQSGVVREVQNLMNRYGTNLGDYPAFLFHGPPGTGKTSCAECIAKTLYGKQWRNYFVETNASDERGIDIVRGKIKRSSKTKGARIIYLGEMDNMTKDAQQALRRIIEKTRTALFILSANYPHKIIEPIQSRCATFVFKPLTKEHMFKRLVQICKTEGIRFEHNSPEEKQKIKEGINYLIESADGDMRKVLNNLEKLINANNAVTVENIITLEKPDLITNAMTTAINGNLQQALHMLEDAYIMNGRMHDTIFRQLGKSLRREDVVKSQEIRARLRVELAKFESRCKARSDPLLQLCAFIDYCWLVPHLKQPELT